MPHKIEIQGADLVKYFDKLEAAKRDMGFDAGRAVYMLKCSEETAPQIKREYMLELLKKVSQLGNWNVAHDSYVTSVSIPKIMAVILGKKIITDPLMQYLFNNGVDALPKFLNYKTREELLLEIERLDSKEQALKNHAHKAEKFSSYMSFSVIAMIMTELMTALNCRKCYGS